MIDLTGKTACIFGLRGTGKSTLSHYILSQAGSRGFLYDTLDESPPNAKYASFTPKIKNSDLELSNIITLLVKSSQYKTIGIDEANRYCPSKPAPLPPVIADLNDHCRHYGMTVLYIARRPCQLNQDLTELSDYLFIYHLKGKADISYLENISQGLGEAVLQLKEFHFIQVNPDRSYKEYPPVEVDQTWIKHAKNLLPKS
jgi:hypothetical protein